MTKGHELKLVVPQPGFDLAELEKLDFRRFSLQPMDNAGARENTKLAVEMCLAHPRWQLSLQTHKVLNIR